MVIGWFLGCVKVFPGSPGATEAGIRNEAPQDRGEPTVRGRWNEGDFNLS